MGQQGDPMTPAQVSPVLSVSARGRRWTSEHQLLLFAQIRLFSATIGSHPFGSDSIRLGSEKNRLCSALLGRIQLCPALLGWTRLWLFSDMLSSSPY